jgi:acyl-coenzyme A synthetase/AMP-(fatty) acid ligase
LTPAVAAHFTARFGLRIHTFYGSSECGGIAYDGEGQQSAGEYEAGFVGQPVAGVRVAPQPDGSIAVESAAVGDGYWPLAEEPDPALALNGGRFIPADVVRLGPAGLYLTGRAADVINVAGRKLNPMEVEAQLLRFPGVRQAVVFGIPSRLRNEEPVACVVGDFDARELLNFARSTLSAWQAPKEIWTVADIPVNERGKVNRRELAKRYAEEKRAD